MSFSNPLQTKLGRLVTFFLLYVAEGLPFGFTTVAVVTEMRSRGLAADVVSSFTALILLPWAFKWAIGPVVDVFYSDRLGRRRMWIVLAQVMMVATLLISLPIGFSSELRLFTVVLLLHNIWAATQDVAIDALACGMLKEEERGLVNGMMFGGSYLGAAVGGAGALFLKRYMAFNATFFVVGGGVLAITLLVSLRLKEPPTPALPLASGKLGMRAALGEIREYLRVAGRAMFGNRAAFVGVIFALLPAGAYALSMPLLSSLVVELNFNDTEKALLPFYTGLISALGCIVGGFLSDRFGRKKMLALYLLGTAIPTLWLAQQMLQCHWIESIDVTRPDRPLPAPDLVAALWTASLVFAVFQGLMYGTRTALFMDITSPAVAATQFTAYMALLNATISYSAFWQGKAVKYLGYPTTLAIDALLGLACIGLLPWMTRRPSGQTDP